MRIKLDPDKVTTILGIGLGAMISAYAATVEDPIQQALIAAIGVGATGQGFFTNRKGSSSGAKNDREEAYSDREEAYKEVNKILENEIETKVTPRSLYSVLEDYLDDEK